MIVDKSKKSEELPLFLTFINCIWLQVSIDFVIEQIDILKQSYKLVYIS